MAALKVILSLPQLKMRDRTEVSRASALSHDSVSSCAVDPWLKVWNSRECSHQHMNGQDKKYGLKDR